MLDKLKNKLNSKTDSTPVDPMQTEEKKEEGLSKKAKLYLIYDDVVSPFYDEKRKIGSIVSAVVIVFSVFCCVYTLIHEAISIPSIFLIIMTVCLDIGLFGLVLGRDIFTDEELKVTVKGCRVKPDFFWMFIAYFALFLVLYILMTSVFSFFPFFD